MKTTSYLRFLCSCVALCVCLGLNQVSVLSQSTSGQATSASLRGSAKIEGKYDVDGVIVVVMPGTAPGIMRSGKPSAPSGNPIPARVIKGEYRIENLVPGYYDLKALGAAIKDKLLSGIKITEGGANILDLELDRIDKPRKVRARIVDADGRPLGNMYVAIYSTALPPGSCEQCILAEARSNERGEIEYPDLGSEQSYSLAMRVDGNGVRPGRVIATNVITIGAKDAEIQLRVGAGSNPDLTAVLRDHAPSENTRPGPQRYLREAVAQFAFETRSAELSSATRNALDTFAQEATRYPDVRLVVSSFIEEPRGATWNRAFGGPYELSMRRAESVIKYLVRVHNIPLDRFVTTYDYRRPVQVASNRNARPASDGPQVEIRLGSVGGAASTPGGLRPQ